MTTVEFGALSVLVLVGLIWIGMHVPTAFMVVSFAGAWFIRGDINVAARLLAIAASDSISEYVFGVIPLFVLMGLVVSIAGMGRDSYAVANQVFRKVPGSLGLSTVGGNAIFAAMTGVSVASATIFTKLAVPEMLRYGYAPRFAVGVVGGSSVLGMLIPPSLLFILFGILTEVSIGKLFLAGIIPGLVLSFAYGAMIIAWAVWRPATFGRQRGGDEHKGGPIYTAGQLTSMLAPIAILVALVLGGIYGGVFTSIEAGAAGAAGALGIAFTRRRLDWKKLWQLLLDTGSVTSSLILLIVGANIYSRMLALTGLPGIIGDWFSAMHFGVYGMLAIYIGMLLFLGCIMDSASILFLTIPLILPVFVGLKTDLVWLGVITVITVEIGLLTPPFGMAVFIIKGSLDDQSITLRDIFLGVAPFAVVMLLVVALIVAFPWLATGLV